MDSDAYFADTEPAVRHMFAALSEYDALTVPPSLAAYANEDGVIRMNRDEAAGYMSDLSDSLALDFAKATLCGSVIQVANMAIEQYSHNETVDSASAGLSVSAKSRVRKFCVGRQVHGIPLGLLIYAARIQYNHRDEGVPKNPVPKAVFEALYQHYASDLTFDMAYALEWPSSRPVAHHILRHELRWMSYDDYITDMREALETSAA